MLIVDQTAKDFPQQDKDRAAASHSGFSGCGMEHRRSFYGIEKKSPVPDERIMALVSFAVRHTPSAMNCQSQMTAVLLGENHDRLWAIVMEALRKIVPAQRFSGTEAKIKGFQAGYGTVLFFNDEGITKAQQESTPLYAENFPIWAEQANGMLQFAIWNLLEGEGFGASLQHYNPLIDVEVQSAFSLSKSWRLIAQMPFGLPSAPPDVKEYAETAARVIQL